MDGKDGHGCHNDSIDLGDASVRDGFKGAVAAQTGQEEVTSGVDASEGPTSASSDCAEDEQVGQDGRRQKRKRDPEEAQTTGCELGTYARENISYFHPAIVLYTLK